MSALSLVTLVLLALVLAAVVITGILVHRLARRMAAHAQENETQLAMARLDSRLSEISHQSGEREKAIRAELRENRQVMDQALNQLGERVRRLGAENTEAQTRFRDKLDEKMKELRTENSQKLDEMRKTVDERLQSTLEKRISESFKSVSERLEQVHKGLGEMQSLATGVGDLKRVLTNVKSRGSFGEVQLELLIDDFLTADQYVTNLDPGKASRERVEYGIRVPGTDRDIYLPVDSKFPTEDYERLLAAVEIADKEATEKAGAALERSIRRFAKDIADKYINPPTTTDWAILFLPTEGLYAEVLRRPGLFESLQRDLRVTVAGPTNFQVILSTFRMGFRQVTLSERASDVWNVLGAVKGEFDKFGDQIQKMAKSLDATSKHVDHLSTRRRQMIRALKSVERVPENSADLLGLTLDGNDDGGGSGETS
ncbi:DNA recombination protein RmuC [Yunchengibacter salinarum]|uniref:DNA recombination protein RmuC n=1 Tax=Yunchengibacter salinarum TaxID=3133399 RepID=UPI0035B5C222